MWLFWNDKTTVCCNISMVEYEINNLQVAFWRPVLLFRFFGCGLSPFKWTFCMISFRCKLKMYFEIQDMQRKQRRINMTACFTVFGILSFIFVADDLGLWLYLDKLYNKKVSDY